MTQAPAPIVHGGAPRLEELLKFVEYSAKPRALMHFLDEVPARLAAIMRADVCSIYLREGDGRTLVLRGNVASLGADCIEKPMSAEDKAILKSVLKRADLDGSVKPEEFKMFGSARRLYHFHIDNVDAY